MAKYKELCVEDKKLLDNGAFSSAEIVYGELSLVCNHCVALTLLGFNIDKNHAGVRVFRDNSSTESGE